LRKYFKPEINLNNIFYLWRNSSIRAEAASFFSFPDSTQVGSSERMISFSHKPLKKHRQRDEHPCPRRNSNPWSK